MIWILFALFLILFAENHFKPRVFKTIYNDWVLWFTWKKERKFYIIFKA